METQAERVIRLFGGVTKLSLALGHKHPSTVGGWKSRGFIPANQQQAVLEAAKRNRVNLTPTDFFDIPPQPLEASADDGARSEPAEPESLRPTGT